MTECPTGKRIIAIDPGCASGAIAMADSALDGHTVIQVMNLPRDLSEFWKLISELVDRADVDTSLVIENVGPSRRGNAAYASYVFAKHRGHLELACVVLKIIPVWVAPRRWMHDLFADEYPTGDANKALRKEYIFTHMRQRWPDVPFTKRQADALGILTWALDNQETK